MSIGSWYEQVDRQLSQPHCRLVELLNEKYAQPWAIPFFGRITEARVLTVGLNPAASEFRDSRWDSVNTADRAAERLLNYFDCATEPHEWFATWEAALNWLDASYYGTRVHLAAHVDIWPRGTRTASEFGEEDLLPCIEADLWCLLSTLEQSQNCTLILMAGSVTQDYYLNLFLQDYLPKDRAELKGSFNPYAQPGPGKNVFHTLRVGSREWPVFFCSTSPSSEQPKTLIDTVQKYAVPIRRKGKL